MPKDVESSSPYDDEIESEDGDIGAETSRVALDSARGLDKVLEAGTDKELERNTSAKLPNLSVKEKKELASYAQSLGKKLKSQQVGKSGVSHTVVMALIETLEANELLKVRQICKIYDTVCRFSMLKNMGITDVCLDYSSKYITPVLGS